MSNLPSGRGRRDQGADAASRWFRTHKRRRGKPTPIVPTGSSSRIAPIGTFLALLLTSPLESAAGWRCSCCGTAAAESRTSTPVPGTLPEPPSELPAPLVGTLVDGVADLQDAVAILVDLAQRSVLSLKHEGGDVRVSLHTATDDPALRSYERVFLVGAVRQWRLGR